MNYSEAIQYLYNLRLFGAKFGLENTVRLAGMAGHPEASLAFIHVAGTNGKGSTCAMLESIYREAGLRTGLFTSPHLVRFGERIQVNRENIPGADVVRLTSEIQRWVGRFPAAAHPTFFEAVTVLALRYFAEQGCDLVIWETGLGGRLDATNIVDPKASVITNVQLDHQQWLGDTIGQIAVEKAGIIKPGRPVITAADDGPAFETIARRALQLGSPCVRVGREAAERAPLDRLELPLRGAHQKLNAALALATVDCLRDTLRVSREAMISGLLKVNWAGRCQLEKTASGQLVLLDGAHNPAGAETLRATLEQHFPGRRPTLILGVLKDKDWHAMCRVLAPVAGRLLLVPVPSERTTTPEMLRLACQEVNPAIETRACHSLAEALAESRQDSLVALAGSLFLVGEAMELMKLAPDENPGERGLNEWNAVPAAHERLR